MLQFRKTILLSLLGTGSTYIFEGLSAGPSSEVDPHQFSRARLVDMIPHFHGLCRGIHLAHVLAVAIVVQICLYSQQVNGYHDGISMFPHSDQQSKSATILVPYIRSRSLMKRDQRQFALQLAKPVELIYGEGMVDPWFKVFNFSVHN